MADETTTTGPSIMDRNNHSAIMTESVGKDDANMENASAQQDNVGSLGPDEDADLNARIMMLAEAI